MQKKGIDKRFATGYDERAGGVDAIGNVKNEGDVSAENWKMEA